MSKDIEKASLEAHSEARNISSQLREFTTDALRYWEVRRLFYNALLAAIVAGHIISAWPVSRDALTFEAILELFILAVLANVVYSVVYAADVFIQMSGFRESRRSWRWVLLLVGFAFAGVVAHFVSKGIASGQMGG